MSVCRQDFFREGCITKKGVLARSEVSVGGWECGVQDSGFRVRDGMGCCTCSAQSICSTVSARATFLPAPCPMAVAAPTAFASASTASSSQLRVKPRTIAAEKLSPHPTVSATFTLNPGMVYNPRAAASTHPRAPRFTTTHSTAPPPRARRAWADSQGSRTPVSASACHDSSAPRQHGTRTGSECRCERLAGDASD